MEEPHTEREHDECDEHGEAEGAHQVAEQRAEGVAEEIADGNKARRPQTRSNEIQYHEPLPVNCAHPHRKRREVAHPIDETKRQNKTGVVTFQPIQCRFDAVPPSGEPVQ